MYILKTIFWSIPTWQRVPNPPILWRLPYIAYPLPPFSNFFNLTLPPLLLFVFPYFFLKKWGLAPHLVCYVLLQYIMDLRMSSLDIAVPQGPCNVFYGTRNQLHWAQTHYVVFCYYSDLISHVTDRQTRTHSTRRVQ